MKRMLSIVVVALFVFASATAYAAPEGSPELLQGMGAKMWRGAVNLLTGWVEIPVQISKGYEKDSFAGAFVGIFTGICHGTGRTISGAGEFAGFWAADPESNDGIGIPLDAEYAWEKGEHYSLTDPDFGQATIAPVNQKLQRGLWSTLFGVAEVPGQIAKGFKTPAADVKIPDLGIIKGLWYFLSREIEGAVELATFFLPGPADTKAMQYDEKWPWSAFGDALEVKA